MFSIANILAPSLAALLTFSVTSYAMAAARWEEAHPRRDQSAR